MHRRARVAITGFGPFAGVDENPTALAVEHLRRVGVGNAGFEPVLEVLPAEYEGVVAPLLALLRDGHPDAVLLTGLRTSSDDVCVERVALNLDDCTLPDNAGALRRGTPIEPDGPAAIVSDLDLDALVDVFTARGIVARISNHAGAFICNRSYYCALREIERLGAAIPCVFVHLPWVNRREIGDLDGAALSVPALAAALVECATRLIRPSS